MHVVGQYQVQGVDVMSSNNCKSCYRSCNAVCHVGWVMAITRNFNHHIDFNTQGNEDMMEIEVQAGMQT